MRRRRIIAVVAFALAVCAASLAQDEPRFALVIGNAAYEEFGALQNPANDAEDIAGVLRSLGFAVTLVTDADQAAMNSAVVRFGNQLSTSRDSVGFLYYAGHGVQASDGRNYFIPVNAQIPSEAFLGQSALSLETVLALLDAAQNKLNIVVLDACRNNPFSWSRSGTRGLAVVGGQPPGRVIAYAAGANQVAQDGTGRNGVYTAALLEHLQQPDLDIIDVFRQTGGAVSVATQGAQTPAIYSQFYERFYLAASSIVGDDHARARVQPTPAPTHAPSLQTTVGEIAIAVRTGGRLSLDGEYQGELVDGQSATLRDVPTGRRSLVMDYGDERETVSVTVAANVPVSARFAFERSPEKAGSLETVLVEGGTFRMGSPSGGGRDERPVHSVTLDSFWMTETEVTFAQYNAFARATGRDLPDDEGWGRGSRPVINVSWYDAVAHANWLSGRDGLTPAYRISGRDVTWNRSANGWRLPTEAEWEYAARGGTQARETAYAGSNSVGEVAWHIGNSRMAGSGVISRLMTHPVGGKQANELGLYDMSGNVWEWCWDWYGRYDSETQRNPSGPASGRYRVWRGGCWGVIAAGSRVANRIYGSRPVSRSYALGFRLAAPAVQ
jgi:formylglycine-generating enzyme required for sulfatase activity